MAITFELDFGVGFIDYSALVVWESISRKRQIHNNWKSTVNQCKLTLAGGPDCVALANALSIVSVDIPARIKDGVNPFFTGYVRPTFGYTVTGDLQTMEMELVDPGFLLDRKIRDVYKAESTTVYAVVGALLLAAGFSAGDNALTNSAGMTTALDLFLVMDDENVTYREVINNLMYEVGEVLYFDIDGKAYNHNLIPTSVVAGYELHTGTAGQLLGELGVQKAERQNEAVEVTGAVHKTLTGAILFEDTEGKTSALACVISVSAGASYPVGSASNAVYSEYGVENYDLVAVLTTPTLSTVLTGTVTNHHFTHRYKNADIRFDGGASGGNINRFKITGDAIVKGDTFIKIAGDGASDRRETYSVKYIHSEAAFSKLADGRWQYLDNSRYTYKAKTDSAVNPGDYVRIHDVAVTGVEVVVRINEVADGAEGDYPTEIVCEGVGAYSVGTVITRGVQTTPPPLSPEMNVEITARPRTADLQDGTFVLDVATIGGTSQDVIADTTAPTNPGSVAKAAHTTGGFADGTVDVTWTASTDTESGVGLYRIWRARAADKSDAVSIGSVTAAFTAYNDSQTIIGDALYYGVSARDKRGNETGIVWASGAITIADARPPATVTGLAIEAYPENVYLNWTAVTSTTDYGNSVGYVVERNINGAGWVELARPVTNDYTDRLTSPWPSAATLATYSYRVKAINTYGTLSASWSSTIAPGTTNYGTYTGTVPTVTVSGLYHTATLKWDRQTNLSARAVYRVQISEDNVNWYAPRFDENAASPPYRYTVLNDYATIYDEAMTHSQLATAGTTDAPTAKTYYFRVLREVPGGTNSAYSAAVSVTISPTAAADIAASAVAASKVDITAWLNLRNENSLKGYWSLDDNTGTSALDSSRNGLHATLTGTTSWVEGVTGGKAVYFNGVYARGDAGAVLAPTGADYTISLWVKPKGVANNYLISNDSSGNSGVMLFYITAANSKVLYYNKADDSSVVNTYMTDSALSADVWYHLVFRRSGTVINCWLNGVLQAAYHTVGTKTFSLNNWQIGGRVSTTSNQYVDEVRVYSVALSESEIKMLYLYPAGQTPGMIYADRIAANAITVDKLIANSITAAKMNVTNFEVDGALNALRMKAGLIYSTAIAGSLPSGQGDSRSTGALNYFELDHPTAGVKFRLGSDTKYIYFDGTDIRFVSVDVELTTADVITYGASQTYRLRHTGLSLICDLSAAPNTQKGSIVFDPANSLIKLYSGTLLWTMVGTSGTFITSKGATDSAPLFFTLNGSTTAVWTMGLVGAANNWFTGTAQNDLAMRFDSDQSYFIGHRVSSTNYISFKLNYNYAAFFTSVLYLDRVNARVGVNTASPASALQIVQPTTTNLGLRIGQDLTNYYSIGRNNSDGILEINGAQATSSGFKFITPAATVLTLGNAGNVSMKGFATDSNENAALGKVGSALATNATTGHAYLPTCAGKPTGVPTSFTGKQAIIVDTTNDILYRYTSAWSVVSASGSYTPAFGTTSNVNTATSVLRTAYWIRIGNQVFVHGQMTIFASGAGRIYFQLTLPVAITTSGYTISGIAVDPNFPVVMSIKDSSTYAFFDNVNGFPNTNAANFSYTFGYYVQ